MHTNIGSDLAIPVTSGLKFIKSKLKGVPVVRSISRGSQATFMIQKNEDLPLVVIASDVN